MVAPSAVPLGYHTATPARGTRVTEHLLSLMRLFEAFSLHAFWREVPYFVDSGTLLGCLRHRGVIPWDNDVDVAMLEPDFTRFVDGFSSDALILDRDAYGDPSGCVWFRDAASGIAGLDLSPYTRDGRSLMSEALQREWPIDAWGTQRSDDSWRYDFGHALDEFVWLPSFAGPQRAPRRWRERLARHYDDLEMDPALREEAMRELGFDPALPPVTPVRAYPTVDEGLRATGALEPFEVPLCREIDLDRARIEDAIRREPRPLGAYHPRSGLRFDTVEIGGEEALRRLRERTLDLNIFDSPSSSIPLDVLPIALRRPNPAHARFPFHLGYLVSPAPHETLFHSDGFVHTYNYLAEGEKWWWFVEPIGADPTVLVEQTITEILTTEGFRRWGRVRVLRQTAGTLVVFPGYWPHRVLTRAPSIGIAGYANLLTEGPR